MTDCGICMVIYCGQQLDIADAAPAYNGTWPTAWGEVYSMTKTMTHDPGKYDPGKLNDGTDSMTTLNEHVYSPERQIQTETVFTTD